MRSSQLRNLFMPATDVGYNEQGVFTKRPMRVSLKIFLFLGSTSAFAQSPIHTLIDFGSKEPIPYVTVYCADQKVNESDRSDQKG